MSFFSLFILIRDLVGFSIIIIIIIFVRPFFIIFIYDWSMICVLLFSLPSLFHNNNNNNKNNNIIIKIISYVGKVII